MTEPTKPEPGLFEPEPQDEGHNQDAGLTLNDEEWEAFVEGHQEVLDKIAAADAAKARSVEEPK
jgi:hypothetical protein